MSRLLKVFFRSIVPSMPKAGEQIALSFQDDATTQGAEVLWAELIESRFCGWEGHHVP
jgi:hypothetical protein